MYKIFQDIFSGIFSSFILVLISVTWANLIFTNLPPFYQSIGICLSLIGAVIMGCVAGYLSKQHYIIVGLQDSIAIICAGVAIDIMRSGKTLSPEEATMTIIIMVGVTSLIFGLICYCVGTFKVGNLMEYIPYPVIAGVLAGTGAIIFLMGMKTTTGLDVNFTTIRFLFSYDFIYSWLPVFLFVLLMIFIIEATTKRVLFAWFVIFCFFGFYLYLWFMDISITEAGVLRNS